MNPVPITIGFFLLAIELLMIATVNSIGILIIIMMVILPVCIVGLFAYGFFSKPNVK